MRDRDLAWVGSSLADIREFPDDVRRAAGYELRRIQQGLMPSDWKPMSTVGKGVIEIRLRGRLQHRVLYIAKFAESIYVLHAFEKKSQKTRESDLAMGRRRLKELEAARQSTREHP